VSGAVLQGQKRLAHYGTNTKESNNNSNSNSNTGATSAQTGAQHALVDDSVGNAALAKMSSGTRSPIQDTVDGSG
jgi:hypothetical protein